MGPGMRSQGGPFSKRFCWTKPMLGMSCIGVEGGLWPTVSQTEIRIPVDTSSRRYAGEVLCHSVFMEPRAVVKDNSNDICFSVWRSMRNWNWLSAEKLIVLLGLCNLNGQEDSLGHACSLASFVTTAGHGVKLRRVKPVAVTLSSQGSGARQNSRSMWSSCPQGIVLSQCPTIVIVS
jgi:hypothetical protein